MTEHTLKEPLSTESGVLSIVRLRAVKVRDLKNAERARAAEGDFAANIALMASVTGLSIEQVEDMGAEDFADLQERLADFLPKASPPTGEA